MRQARIPADGARRQTSARQEAISEQEIADFTRQLATMLKAGLPMANALETMSRGQHRSAAANRMLADIRCKIGEGSSFFTALETAPFRFDTLYLQLVCAGEQTGALDALLERLASQMERALAIKGKLKSMLYYPALNILVALVMIAIVFPGLFFPVLLSLAALIGGVWGILKARKTSRDFRIGVDRLLLDLPVFGKLARDSAIARWSRVLATAYASGMPLIEAVRLLDGATGNHVYDRACHHIHFALERGDTLLQAVQAARVFPEVVLQTITVGDSTGKLDGALNRLAEYHEQEVDLRTATIISLIPPIITIVLGILVGILLVIFYTGRFSAIDSLGL
ncbi:MAG: type II secretion system F family protein [Zoogloeaceae bacterium]|jgi:type IV pilus assembly protein PilC|nr:type II secretion system F family protein [Zoogloeaceae bacterium]